MRKVVKHPIDDKAKFEASGFLRAVVKNTAVDTWVSTAVEIWTR